MKLCRFQPQVFRAEEVRHAGTTGEFHPEVLTGVISGDTVREISGDIFGGWRPGTRSWPLNAAKLLPPVVPSKIVCLGRNFREHAAELGHDVPKEPLIFLKAPSAIIALEEPIVIPRISQRVDYEGELAVIIGRRSAQLADGADVRPYILGYTCVNDVTARDLQKLDVQFTRAKGFDTFCPMGPVIETEFDLSTTRIETYVNGAVKQSAPASEMIFPVDVIIRWVSRMMTLEPGDVVSTGTPAGVGPLRPGDVVEVVVSGIGTLRNPVIAQEA